MFNEKTMIELDSDDDEDYNGGYDDAFAAGDDEVRPKKPKIRYVPPSELPDGSPVTPVIWTSDNDNQCTCEQLLALAAEKRLGLQADRMRAAAISETMTRTRRTTTPSRWIDLI